MTANIGREKVIDEIAKIVKDFWHNDALSEKYLTRKFQTKIKQTVDGRFILENEKKYIYVTS